MITIRIDEKDTSLLTVSFFKDPIGNDLIRIIPGRRWNYSRRCWVVPNRRDAVVQIGQLFGKDYCRFDEAIVRLYKPTVTSAQVEQATNPPWPPLNQRMARDKVNRTHRLPFRYVPSIREYDQHPVIVDLCNALKIQNYSFKTLKNYKQAIIALIRYADPKPIDDLTRLQYQKYLLFLIEKKQLGSSTLNVHINAYKFYSGKILHREKEFYDIDYPRKSTKLPTVYTLAEVRAIFKATTSLKYRTLFQLVYATGLRLSEVTHLRLNDLDRTRRLITVRAGKGKKDRVVMLSDKLEVTLNKYLERYSPETYFFEDADTREPMRNRAIQQVYSDTVRFAGITKQGGIHTLRHSFATHLLESGTDIRYIQQLPGTKVF